jgi:predicted aspartyl protease
VVILGKINARREIVFSLSIMDQHGEEHEIEVVLDTGFNDFLTLPEILIDALRLPYISSSVSVILGDGSEIQMRRYDARILWGNSERRVKAYAAEGPPLIGMAMIYGHDLHAHILDGADATLFPL